MNVSKFQPHGLLLFLYNLEKVSYHSPIHPKRVNTNAFPVVILVVSWLPVHLRQMTCLVNSYMLS